MKPFVCVLPQCRHRFTQKASLKIHELIHLNVKQFKCHFNYSNQTFEQRANLKTHSLIHWCSAIESFGALYIVWVDLSIDLKSFSHKYNVVRTVVSMAHYWWNRLSIHDIVFN